MAKTRKKADQEANGNGAGKSEAAQGSQVAGLKIVAMQVENIKRVTFARIRPQSDVVIISGKNGSGKSTLLDSIEMGIAGTTRIPSQPIKRGASHGKIEIDLGEFRLTRHFSRVDPTKSADGSTYFTKLTLEGKNKEIYRSPQTLLESFMGKISFDPLEFIRMDTPKQFETLRSISGVQLDAIDAEKKQAYELRRQAGRDLDSAKARLAALPAPPEDLPAEPIDTAALTRRLQEAAQHNNGVAGFRREQAKELQRAEDLRGEAKQAETDIAVLEQKIVVLRQMAAEARNLAEQHAKRAQDITIPAETDTAEVARELTQAQVVNGAIERAKAYQAIARQVADAEAAWTDLDATVKQKEKERIETIAKAKMPIANISLGEGEVLWDGLPFDQASNAEQIKVSVALAMASNPKLRVLRIKDGSLLDDSTLAQIAGMATGNGYQVWVERVEGGPAQVVMEEGEASGPDVEVMPDAPKAKKEAASVKVF